MEDRFVSAWDWKLHYILSGEGPPLVLIPGAMNTWKAWRRVIPFLEDRYRIYAFDYLGTGKSDKPQNFTYSIADQARVFTEVIGKLGLEAPVIAGHSYGGVINLCCAVANPGLVKGCICVEGGSVKPSVLPARGPEMILRVPVLGHLFVAAAKTGLVNKLILRSMAGSWYSDLTPEEREELRDQICDTMQSGTRTAWHGVCASPAGEDFVSSPDQLSFPLLYIYGEQSELMESFVSPNLEYLEKYVPHALLRKIEGGVHNCHIQKPELTAQFIDEFVRSL